MTTPKELEQKIQKLPTNLDRFNGQVNGPASGPGSMIETDNGPVRSYARWLAETGGAKGDPGGDASQIGTLGDAKTVTIPIAVDKITITGATTVGDVMAGVAYTRNPEVTQDQGSTQFVDREGAGWEIVDTTPFVRPAIFHVPRLNQTSVLNGTEEGDATAWLQAAIDSGAKEVRIDGRMKIGRVRIGDKQGFKLIGGKNAQLVVTGSAPRDGAGNLTGKQGLELFGQIDDLEISGLDIICDGVAANGHAGVWSNSGGSFSNINIRRLRVYDPMVGISVNTNLSGEQRSIHIHEVEVYRPRGTASGEGYGIHVADGSGGQAGILIENFLVDGAERHSIYVAKGSNARVRNGTIRNHRSSVKAGNFRAALNVLRSNEVTVSGVLFENCSDGALFMGRSAVGGRGYEAHGNRYKVTGAANNVPQIAIGSINPAAIDPDAGTGATEGSPTNVYVHDEAFDIDGNDCEPIRINCGQHVQVSSIRGTRVNVNGTASVVGIRGFGGDAYNSDLRISDLTLDQTRSGAATGTQARVRFYADVVGTTFSITLERIAGRADVAMVGTAPDNPNISLYDMEVNVNAFASGIYPRGRFMFRTTIPGFTPPSLPANSAVPVNLSVAGIRAGDSVNLTFPVGASNVTLTGQANFNNNVRSLWNNLAAAPAALPAGDLVVLAHILRP